MGALLLALVLWGFAQSHDDCAGRWADSMLVQCPRPAFSPAVADLQGLPPAPQVRRFGVDFNAPVPGGFAPLEREAFAPEYVRLVSAPPAVAFAASGAR